MTEAGTNGRLLNGADAKAFILAGKARVTLVSEVTGVRFTYRVSQARRPSPHFVSVLTGSDNESSYTYMATIFDEESLRWTQKSKIRSSAPSALAFHYAWSHLVNGILPPRCEVWHEGRCGCCGRALTKPESIASGFGPVCGARR